MASSSSSSASTTHLFHNLTSIKLDHKNFLIWKSQILPTLKGYGLYPFVTGTNSAPEAFLQVDAADGSSVLTPNPAFTIWEEQDQRILSWLLSTLSESILAQVVGESCTTSKAFWSALERTFASQSQARLMQLRLQLQTVKKGLLPMAEYLQKIKSIIDSLVGAVQNISQQDFILYVLGGLGPKYESLTIAVTTRTDPIAIEDLQGMLLTHEIRLESLHSNSPTANLAFGSGGISKPSHFQRSRRSVSSPSDYSAENETVNRLSSQNSNGYQINGPSSSSKFSHSDRASTIGLGGPSTNGLSILGRGPNRNKIQCQLCGRFGYAANVIRLKLADVVRIKIQRHTLL
ncbi:uncharacterized protein LOC124934779 [Impatiens glandulifera]|uniref:uncharacterized protein LOC124934779 n=1 Tax=Impatiens glandulifera TaxID=253017 RepID=UPI001FB16D44|nr:uncharacterized protein LOC124934779 [Impatiens glandulifera]